MRNATELGKVIREYMAKNNLSQEKLAEELGLSDSMLSNYIIGKNIPDTKFLAKCIQKFKLQNAQLSEFFRLSFISSAKSKNKVLLDTQFIDPDRLEMLSKILTVVILYPEIPYNNTELENIRELGFVIGKFYNALATRTTFKPPAKSDT